MGFIQTYMMFVILMMMFSLGLTLVPEDFLRVLRNPVPVLIGLLCQLVGLPLIAFLLIAGLRLSPFYAMGILLVVCSPGGPGSNFFTAVAKGDTALSVSLTAVSCLVTVFTMPLILSRAALHYSGSEIVIRLDFWSTFLRMLLNILLPMILAMIIRYRWDRFARNINPYLQKISMVLLTFGIGGYVVIYFDVIVEHGPSLSGIVCLLLASTMTFGFVVSSLLKLPKGARTAITIEIGIQNASQAILIAVHPVLLNDITYAFPSFIYGLIMYVFVIPFMWFEKRRTRPGGKGGLPKQRGSNDQKKTGSRISFHCLSRK